MLRIAPLLSTFDPASLYSFVSSSSESFHAYPSNFGRFILYRYGMRLADTYSDERFSRK